MSEETGEAVQYAGTEGAVTADLSEKGKQEQTTCADRYL